MRWSDADEQVVVAETGQRHFSERCVPGSNTSSYSVLALPAPVSIVPEAVFAEDGCRCTAITGDSPVDTNATAYPLY
jgi:hypothetical protein